MPRFRLDGRALTADGLNMVGIRWVLPMGCLIHGCTRAGLHSRHGVQADRSGHQRDSPVPEGDEMLDGQRTGRP